MIAAASGTFMVNAVELEGQIEIRRYRVIAWTTTHPETGNAADYAYVPSFPVIVDGRTTLAVLEEDVLEENLIHLGFEVVAPTSDDVWLELAHRQCARRRDAQELSSRLGDILGRGPTGISRRRRRVQRIGRLG